MPLMMGLTMAASRSTTNSKPSAETRVTYLLAAVVAMLLAIGDTWRATRREMSRGKGCLCVDAPCAEFCLSQKSSAVHGPSRIRSLPQANRLK